MSNIFLNKSNTNYKFSIMGIILACSFFFVSITSACGCGMMITSDESGAWKYGEDSKEQSFINFENGKEKLIISLDIKNTSRDSVLVIPIPSVPDKVKADVLSDVPRFEGYNVSEKAKRNLSDLKDRLLGTQIYPIIISVFLQTNEPVGGSKGINTMSMPGSSLDGAIENIIVYQHLEKNGMIAEVLSATDSSALYNYLTQKGLRIEMDSIPVFGDYINKDFSFVVSWVNPLEVNSSARGILMTFPVKEIYYPLKPGSVYSGAGMDKTITAVGHVSPKLFSDIKSSTEVEYFYSNSKSDMEDFFKSDEGFGFTKIIINAEPKKLTEDLYMSDSAPLKIINAQLINLHGFIYGLLLLIIISFVSTYLVIRVLFASAEVRPGFIGLSIFNCFTIIGTIIGSRRLLQEKRIKFVVLFSLTFVILTMVIISLLSYLY